jgi:O-antigen/teichoic acid export membrane protein/glycosyltransferase involved in cell wall biosynthesis
LKPFDATGAFNPSVPEGGDALRRLAVRSAGMTIFSGGVSLAIQVVATVVLARLLTPRDFGLVAMVTTFSLLLVNFGLNGITEAVVQREQIDNTLASNLFWINLGAGVLLTIGFAAAGSLIAKFYGDPHVTRVAIGISATIFLTSISVLHLGLLKRAMQFSAVAINDIVARALAVVVSIVFGWAGWGYWALVIGACALPFSTAVGAWLMCRWIPGRPRYAAGTGTMLRFAMHTYGRFSVNYCTRNGDNLLVGWRFGAHALGFYKKAYDLFALSATQLVSSTTVVAVSALSRVRNDSARYRRDLLGAIGVMAFLGMGLAADFTLVGKDLIRVLLGPGWEPAGRIFTFFAPGIGAMIVYHTHGWIHLSIGRADRWFRWGLVELAVTFLLFFLGLRFGPDGIALAWCVSFWILTIPAMWYAGKPIDLGVGLVLSAVWRYTVAALLAGLSGSLISSRLGFLVVAPGASGAALRIAVVSLSFLVLYLGAIVLLYGGLAPLQTMVGLLREMAPASKIETMFGGNGATDTTRVTESNGAYSSPARTDMRPLVSILIPAHNAQEWIAGTIRSAQAQTWEPKEIIVVDDGSKDRTLEIARRFESKSVRVVAQPNQGASAARNTAFSLSHGDYIQWLDADDLLAPDKIARQMEAVQQGTGKRTLLSSGWGRFMYRVSRAEFTPTPLWCDLAPVEWLLRKMGQNLYMQTGTWLVSRELVEAAGPWDIRLLGDDDGEYFCRVLLASDGVQFVPGAKVYYRCFGYNGLSYVGRSPQKLRAHWLSMQLHIRYLQSLEQSPRIRAACIEYLRMSLIYFYPERLDIVAEAEQMAKQFGDQLGVPNLSWKYSWIEKAFGWRLVKPAQRFLRKIRWWLERQYDWALFQIQDRKFRTPTPDLRAGLQWVDTPSAITARALENAPPK